MNITIQPQARLYTYKEMKQYLDDGIAQYRAKMVEELSKKKDVVADAIIYDELLTQEYLTCETLRRLGWGKRRIERYLAQKSELADEINSDSLDYRDVEGGVDSLLGYHLTDKSLTESLKERASR